MKVLGKKNNRECNYLTEGKSYEAYHVSKNAGYFEVESDNGILTPCLFRGCFNIKADWTIIGNKAVVA